MKTKKLLFILLIVVFMIFMIGCDKEDDINEFNVLVEFMTDNGLDLPAMLADTYALAGNINPSPENYFIMDIRSSALFATGHISGAINVTLANVVAYEATNNAGDLPVVVACETGHVAGHAVMALRLSGVSTAKVLKWGMSSWHSDFAVWNSKTGNTANDYPGVWVDNDAITTLPSFTDTPELDTGVEDGAAILDYQIANAVVDGLNGIVNTEVLSAYGSLDLYNYWAKADWDKYGYITSAYQLTPGELGLESLDILDPSATNVIYCWSGQTASLVAAWLNAVGYDARTLKFGANSMIYDDLQGHKWGVNAKPGEFDYVTN